MAGFNRYCSRPSTNRDQIGVFLNMNTIFFVLLSLCAQIMCCQNTTAVFPDDYFGIYSGTLEIHSKHGSQSIPMEFHFQPTDSVGKYSYTLVYEGDFGRQERAYHLIEQNKERGEYVVDENNGIILDDKVLGNRMYALFEVGGSLLTTFITFEDDTMIFEIVASNKDDRRVTFADNEDKTEVISYPISTVQRAVLQKQ